MIDKKMFDPILEQLNEAEAKSVLEFAQFLAHKRSQTNKVKTYYDGLPEVDETWSDEEKRQLEENSEWVEWDEFERSLSEKK